MSLAPILGAASQVLGLFGSQSTSSAANAASSSTDTSTLLDSSGNVDLSQAAQFLSKLQDLSQSNPSQFKKLTAEISSQLQADAQSATTASSQSFLNGLASQFSTASQTGSASSLQPSTASPQTGSHHGHGHHSTSQAAYTEAIQNTATDTQSLFAQQLQSL
jgi:hypothetical protein